MKVEVEANMEVENGGGGEKVGGGKSGGGHESGGGGEYGVVLLLNEPSFSDYRILQTHAPTLVQDIDQSVHQRGVGEGRFFWHLTGSQPPVHQAKEKVGKVVEPQKKRPWDGWFSFNDDVTVTQTIVHHMTKKIEDPNTVVKFSVKGCEPTRLPFDLPQCNDTVISRTNADIESASISKDIHYVPV
ncbi:hypothetical protein M8J76_017023 [Diaphorina citri]|nr:hypothetical protein M8J76_017023 [Diaphorina citri]